MKLLAYAWIDLKWHVQNISCLPWKWAFKFKLKQVSGQPEWPYKFLTCSECNLWSEKIFLEPHKHSYETTKNCETTSYQRNVLHLQSETTLYYILSQGWLEFYVLPVDLRFTAEFYDFQYKTLKRKLEKLENFKKKMEKAKRKWKIPFSSFHFPFPFF